MAVWEDFPVGKEGRNVKGTIYLLHSPVWSIIVQNLGL
jgi:hypothetical protein